MVQYESLSAHEARLWRLLFTFIGPTVKICALALHIFPLRVVYILIGEPPGSGLALASVSYNCQLSTVKAL